MEIERALKIYSTDLGSGVRGSLRVRAHAIEVVKVNTGFWPLRKMGEKSVTIRFHDGEEVDVLEGDKIRAVTDIEVRS